MLGNCEDKIISSSTTNQWPQIILDDHTPSMASPSSNNNNNKSMAAAAAAADPSSTTPLKCPRCDSSNTKFCYYNNYSLSQPRHFCKACKRYWTRGGTLRNVPVGGGCRKNKRHKRHSSSSASASADVSSQPQIDLPPPSQSPNLFYGNPLELSFPFSSFRVSSDDGGFDLHHPQINALGLGFSSESYKNGFKPIQDGNASSSPFSAAASNNNNSIFFGSSSFSSASTMASLLSSTQKFGAATAFKDFQSHNNLMPYDDNPQMAGTGKQAVKAEGENRFSWNPSSNPNPSPNPMDQINSSDPSSLVWNTSSISAWFDPSTMGSSVPSLI